jgi:GH15 family glucan-1,4-alpha-glucosidase
MARIEDQGLIGDTRTVALVSNDGSVHWACFPRFDSGACFAALLGDRRHGRWRIGREGEVRARRRRYRPRTLILETELTTFSGTCRLIDFMPLRGHAPDIVRIIEGVAGAVDMTSDLVLRFDSGRSIPSVRRQEGTLTAIEER